MIKTKYECAIEILEYAIKENISIAKASTFFQRNPWFVKDIKNAAYNDKQQETKIKELYQRATGDSYPTKKSGIIVNNSNTSTIKKRTIDEKYAIVLEILKTAFNDNISTNGAEKKLGYSKSFVRNFKYRFFDELSNSQKNELNSFYNRSAKNKKVINNSVEKEEEFDKRTSYTIVRDSDGKIQSYDFLIAIKNEKDFKGSLTREQMELIYQYYPYVTRNTVSSYFPYLTFVQLKRILRCFNVTKEKLFPQHILEEYDENTIAEFGLKNKEKAALDKMIERKSSFIEKKYTESLEEIAILKNTRKFIDETIRKYYEGDYKEQPFPINIVNGSYTDVAYLFYSDIHYGKKYSSPKFGRGYNKEIAHERMVQIATKTIDYINFNNLKSLYILFGGDLLESIQPDGMRAGHTKNMDLIGHEQLFYAVNSQTEFLKLLRQELGPDFPIHNTQLSGNHDRIGFDRNDDLIRTGGQIAFHMIKSNFQSDSKMSFLIPQYPHITDTIMTTDNKNNICIVAHHGDNGLMKKKASELVNLLGIGNMGYHLVINGHWHSSEIKYECGTNYMQIQLPSVASVDDYIHDNMGSNPLAGFVLGMAENNGFSYSNMTLY